MTSQSGKQGVALLISVGLFILSGLVFLYKSENSLTYLVSVSSAVVFGGYVLWLLTEMVKPTKPERRSNDGDDYPGSGSSNTPL